MDELPKIDLWCIEANIKREIPYGPGGKEIRKGLVKFRPGAKIHIVGAFCGMCENIVVIGRHRNTNKFVSCIIPANTVENLRVRKIYRPQIIDFLKDYQPNGAYMSTSKESSEELKRIIPVWVENYG